MDFGGYEAFDETALGQELEAAPPSTVGKAELAQAKKAYAPLVAQGVRIVAGKLPSHSNRLVLVFVPPRVVEGTPFDVRVHYHGMYATASRPAAAAELPRRMWAQMDRSPTTVFVFPFAPLVSPKPGAPKNFPDWSGAKQSRQTALEALKLAGLSSAPQRVVVSGHSAGGRALSTLARRGGLDCDLLILEDCLYGTTKRDLVAWSKTALGQACREVIYFHGTNSTWMCPVDLPNHSLRLACTNGKHYGHVLLDPLAPIAACGCPAKKKQQKELELELEDSEGVQNETPVEMVSRTTLIPFVTANIPVSVATAKSLLKLVCLYLDVPWPVAFVVFEHEGGIEKLRHDDGVMQVIDSARDFHIPRIPEPLKQQIVNDTTLTGAALNRRFDQVFHDGSRPSRQLAAQLAAGVQELKYQLVRYQGFVALAYVAYNTGNANAWVKAQKGTAYEKCLAAASAYHQPVSSVLVTGGQWLCDPQIPAWAWQVRIVDAATNRPLRGFKYLRRVQSSCSQRPPVAECTVPKATRPCAVPLGAKDTRYGALDKLFDVRHMRRAYRDAVQGEWPALADDGRPVRAVGRKVQQLAAVVASELELESELEAPGPVPVKVTPVAKNQFLLELKPLAADQQSAALAIFGRAQVPAGFLLRRSGNGWELTIETDPNRPWYDNIPWARYQAHVKPSVQELLHRSVPSRFNVPKPGGAAKPIADPDAAAKAKARQVTVEAWTSGTTLVDTAVGTRSVDVRIYNVRVAWPMTPGMARLFFFEKDAVPKGYALSPLDRSTWTQRWRVMVPAIHSTQTLFQGGGRMFQELRTHLATTATPDKRRLPEWIASSTAAAIRSKQLPPKNLALKFPKPGIVVWTEGNGVFWFDTRSGQVQGFHREPGSGVGRKMWNNWNEKRIVLEGMSPARAAEQTVADMDSTNKQMLMAFAQSLAANRPPEPGVFQLAVKGVDVTGKFGLHDQPTGTDDLWQKLREQEAKKGRATK